MQTSNLKLEDWMFCRLIMKMHIIEFDKKESKNRNRFQFRQINILISTFWLTTFNIGKSNLQKIKKKLTFHKSIWASEEKNWKLFMQKLTFCLNYGSIDCINFRNANITLKEKNATNYYSFFLSICRIVKRFTRW